MTGKRRQVERPARDQMSSFREELVIIDRETWEKAQQRWRKLEGVWPMTNQSEKTSETQLSYIHSSPTHLLAGLLKCKCCSGAIVQISGKGGGYYGCYNAKRKTCKNKLLIQRKRVETILLHDLQSKFLTAENLQYVYENVEKTVAKTLNEVPEELRQKRGQLENIQTELQSLLNFVKSGNFSKVVSEALTDAESRSDKLRGEIDALEFQRKGAFKAPPKEWVEFRLKRFVETLNKNTKTAALALRELLGAIEMEPVPGECVVENGRLIESRSYYMAHTSIQTLALLDEETKGSNWLKWRIRH